jgi:hypothetical protein
LNLELGGEWVELWWWWSSCDEELLDAILVREDDDIVVEASDALITMLQQLTHNESEAEVMPSDVREDEM